MSDPSRVERLSTEKIWKLLLVSSLFSLNGIWASVASSELILCIVSWMMLKNFQGKTWAKWCYEQVQ